MAEPSAQAKAAEEAIALVERGSINCKAGKDDGINALWTVYMVDRSRLISLVSDALRERERLALERAAQAGAEAKRKMVLDGVPSSADEGADRVLAAIRALIPEESK